MSPRDPKSATAEGLKGQPAKSRGDASEQGKPDGMPDELCRWIDLVIVPILVEQYQQEKEARKNTPDG